MATGMGMGMLHTVSELLRLGTIKPWANSRGKRIIKTSIEHILHINNQRWVTHWHRRRILNAIQHFPKVDLRDLRASTEIVSMGGSGRRRRVLELRIMVIQVLYNTLMITQVCTSMFLHFFKPLILRIVWGLVSGDYKSGALLSVLWRSFLTWNDQIISARITASTQTPLKDKVASFLASRHILLKWFRNG